MRGRGGGAFRRRDRGRASGSAGENPGHAAGAQGGEPQGRVPRDVRRSAQVRLCARPRGRCGATPGRAEGAGQEEAAHGRGGGGPAGRGPQPARASERLGRDSPARREWNRAGRGRARGPCARLQRRARLPQLRGRAARAVAPVIFFQQSARHVRGLQRTGLEAGSGSRPGGAQPGSVSPRRCHRALGRAPGARRRLDLAYRRGAATRVRHSARQAMEAAHPAPARDRPLRNRRAPRAGELVRSARRGLVGHAFRGRGQQHQAPPDRDPLGDDAAVAGTLLSRTALSRLQGQASASRVARGVSGWQEHRGHDRHDRGPGGPALRDHAAQGSARRDCV